MEGKYTGKRMVHSDAEIEARVWYSKSQKEKFVQEKKELTGESEKKYLIKINNFRINLYKSVPKFENYDTINESKKLRLFSNFYLPIELEIINYIETKNVKKEYNYDELKNKIINDIRRQLNEEVGNNSNIINIQINEKNTGEELELEVIYEVLENIGITQKIEEENIFISDTSMK